MPLDVAFIFMLSLLTFRLLTTVIHELGHAIPALLLTKEKVTVYMGSLGNPEKSLQFQLGRLECFFKFNLFYWKGGLCVMHAKNISIRTSFIVTICGPLLSLLVAGIGSLILINYEFDDVPKLVIFALVFSCIVDFLNNIVPKSEAVTLHDGKLVNNDGRHLKQLWTVYRVNKIPKKAFSYYQEGEYIIAAELSALYLTVYPEAKDVYRLAITSFIFEKEMEKAAKIQKIYTEKFGDSFDEHDFINLGNLAIDAKNFPEALEALQKAYKLDSNDVIVLNNYGFVLSILEKHEEAIVHFNKAIPKFDVDPSLDTDNVKAFCYCNRGFSKLELGLLEEGLKDTKIALDLDPTDAYAYRNFGLYHFYNKEYAKAADFYQKAIEMDPKIPNIQECIAENNSKLSV